VKFSKTEDSCISTVRHTDLRAIVGMFHVSDISVFILQGGCHSVKLKIVVSISIVRHADLRAVVGMFHVSDISVFILQGGCQFS
jgi:hypothetical protein